MTPFLSFEIERKKRSFGFVYNEEDSLEDRRIPCNRRDASNIFFLLQMRDWIFPLCQSNEENKVRKFYRHYHTLDRINSYSSSENLVCDCQFDISHLVSNVDRRRATGKE